MNRVQLRGRLTADARQFKDAAKKVIGLGFRVATENISNNTEGKPVKRTEFHQVYFFKDAAKDLALRKGAMVDVTGSIQRHSQRRDGSTREIVAVYASQVAPSGEKECVNRVKLIGNLARDPAPAGRDGVSVRLITNSRYTTEDGEPREYADGHTVFAAGKAAEMARRFKKGDWVEVVGYLHNGQSAASGGRRGNGVLVVAFQVVSGPKAKAAPSAA